MALAVKVGAPIGVGLVAFASHDKDLVARLQRQGESGVHGAGNGEGGGQQGVGVAAGNGDGTAQRDGADKGVGKGMAIVLIEKGPAGLDDGGVLAPAAGIHPGVTLTVKIGPGIGEKNETVTRPEGNFIAFINRGHEAFHGIGAGPKRNVYLGIGIIAARQGLFDIPDDVLRIGLGGLGQSREGADRKRGRGQKEKFFHGIVVVTIRA